MDIEAVKPKRRGSSAQKRRTFIEQIRHYDS
jgi:hypothetical protein